MKSGEATGPRISGRAWGSAAAVFYAISASPTVGSRRYAGKVAKAAVDTIASSPRITNVPVLWVSDRRRGAGAETEPRGSTWSGNPRQRPLQHLQLFSG